jgi:hypothetical protein
MQSEADQPQCKRYANPGQPLIRAVQREPGGDARPKPDDGPGRKLRTLTLKEAFQLPLHRGDPRLPKAPSTLWKRRTRYVRALIHCIAA